jgi:putative Mn2+ efflux pump MntP
VDNYLLLGIIFTVTGLIALGLFALGRHAHTRYGYLSPRATLIVGIVLVVVGLPLLVVGVLQRTGGL